MDFLTKRKTVAMLFAASLVTVAVLVSLYSSQREESSEGKRTASISNTPAQDPPMKRDSILIVYLTRTGNTEAVAEMIQDTVGGTLVSLELERPYPENYQAHVAQVVRENDTDYLPPLKTSIENIENYETVFLGFPTWDMQLPPPIKSFLSQYDLSGKIIIPFNTNGGYGVGTSFREVEERCSNCTVLEGFSVEGGRERDGILFVMEEDKEIEVRNQVRDWLEKIGMATQ
jgi:flavodoxin